MDILLDTHALIWFIEGDKQLSARAKNTIEKNEGINFVSIATLWEIAIKVSLNKLELKKPFSKISEQILNNGFQILPITFEDTLRISKLPFHHRDPFDRIISSQGFTNSLAIISKDDIFKKYEVNVIW